ncbi:uncharacterized protein CELE_C06C6.7 [Caenorhabditis elegans]|uniref:Domain of unknown function WSN domain-containing protein n=1 Tax=Caenorhabditis elegans TaxID=6239 RepID=O62033_CAEEL|nr:protein of unknown function WSN domain-containing protein [Caenorhabditis elegans]CAB07557.1 Domain of unknown function WSN domain-containing protein [Caenorhabditis elegans]|eukprot:NP_507012.1 Uncharacterized protein CELE_C06C6.7 [Caenorhabditis elegans]
MRIKSIISMIILLKITIFGIITISVECVNSNINNNESLDYSSRRQFVRAVNPHDKHSNINNNESLDYSNRRPFARAVSDNEDPATLFKKLPAVARLVTAIAIINGFSDGSIPADPVIAELLNIDTASLKQLEKFNKTSVDKFIESVSSAAMDSSNETLTVEQAMLDVFKIMTIWERIGKLENISTTYSLASLKPVESWSISEFKNFNLMNTLGLIDKIVKAESSPIPELKKQLAVLASAVTNLPPATTMKPFIVTLEKWALIDSFVDIMLLHNSHFDVLLFTSPSFNAHTVQYIPFATDPDISVMKDVVVSLFSCINRTVTAGFANGISDIEKLSSDSKDRWIDGILKPSVPLSNINILSKFAVEMKKLNYLWNPVSTETHYHMMRQVFDLQKHRGIRLTQNAIDSISNTLETKCLIADMDKSFLENMKQSAKHVKLLLRKVQALESIRNAFTSKVINDFNKLSTQTKSSDVSSIRTVLRSLSQSFKLIQNSKSLQKHVTGAQTLNEVYAEPHTQPLVTRLECLMKEIKNTDKIASILRSVKILRKLKSDRKLVEKFKEVSSAVSKSLPLLVSLRKIAEEYKKDNSSGMTDLKKLKPLQGLSKPFGDAVGALVSITKVSRSELETFVRNGESTQKIADIYGTPEQQRQFESQWGNFEATTQQIEMFLSDASIWEKSIAIKKNLNLSAYGQMFKDLTILNSIDVKLEPRLAATEGFDNITTNQRVTQIVAEFRASLMELSKLDLDFSRYKSAFNSMKEVLRSVEAGFKGEKLELSISVSRSGNVTTTTEFAIVATSSYSGLVYTVGTLVIAVILVTITFLWCWYDQSCIYHKLKRRYITNMKTAPELGSITPDSSQDSQSEREAERFVARKPHTSQLPPPPTPSPATLTPTSANTTTAASVTPSGKPVSKVEKLKKDRIEVEKKRVSKKSRLNKTI